MRIACLLLLTSSCVGGGEERSREDNSFHVAFVRWEAQLADGTDAGSGCVLTNNKDSYGAYLVISAEPGATVHLSETFQRFRTTSEAWSGHPDDDAYWCGKSGAERWASVPNPRCWKPVGPDQASARCSNFTLVDTEIAPPGEYPDAPYVKDVDGFRLTLEIGGRGEHCVDNCDSGQDVAFVVQ